MRYKQWINNCFISRIYIYISYKRTFNIECELLPRAASVENSTCETHDFCLRNIGYNVIENLCQPWNSVTRAARTNNYGDATSELYRKDIEHQHKLYNYYGMYLNLLRTSIFHKMQIVYKSKSTKTKSHVYSFPMRRLPKQSILETRVFHVVFL